MGIPTALRNGTLLSLPEELVLRNGFFLTYLFCVCALIHMCSGMYKSQKKGTGASLVAHSFNGALKEAEQTETHTLEANLGYTGIPGQSGLLSKPGSKNKTK